MPRAGMPELNRLTAHLDPPFAVVDLDAFDRNADSLVRRAGGTPIRVASKSVRVRSLLSRVLAWPGFAGVMAFSLAEALWLIETGTLPTDQGVPVDQGVLVAYPSVDRAAFAQLAASSAARRRVVVMADDDAHLDVAEAVMRGPERVGDEPLRVCVDVDASNRVGRIHLGARRSPLRTAAEVSPLLRRLVASPDLTAACLMFYDAQIAGVADTSPVVRAMQERSARELVTRRAAVVAAARDIAGEGLLVNAGETGSLHVLAGDASVTELAAGSGLFAPHLFDSYSSFTPEPAAFFVLPVVRRPAPGIATVLGGGFVASGQAGSTRLPRPWWPEGLRFIKAEGAGEVQTPVLLPRGGALEIGDRVWFRHAKAGELCERVDELHLVSGGVLSGSLPTYRGEGRCFG